MRQRWCASGNVAHAARKVSRLGTVANLHLAAAIPNTTFFEYPHDPPAFAAEAYQRTLKTPLSVVDGMVQVPQEPGLGVELQDWIFG